MPNVRPEPLRDLFVQGLRAEDDLETSHQHPDLDDVEVSERTADVADQTSEEPGAILPLERDLLVVHDYRRHHRSMFTR